MRLTVREVPGLLKGGEGGTIAVSDEAPALLWLAGLASGDAVTVLSAFEAPTGDRPADLWLQVLANALPEGLQLVGVFARDGPASPALRSQVPAASWLSGLRVLAARGEDGLLAAWELQGGAAASPAASCELLGAAGFGRTAVRGRLSAKLQRPGEQLGALAGRLGGLRFRFQLPGADKAAPTLAEMEQQARPHVCVPDAAAGAVSVDLLSEDWGSGGPTNLAYCDELGEDVAEFCFDVVAYVAPGAPAAAAAAALVAAVRRQLEAAARAEQLPPPWCRLRAVRCYGLEQLGHLICLPGGEDLGARAQLHRLLRLPQAPLLLPDCALPFGGEAHPMATGKLVNPHVDCGRTPGWWKGGPETRSVFVRGAYEYCHYMQDRFDDNGWGCAYRSLQTCVSWYRMQFYCDKPVPGIADIQKQLKRIDEAHKDIVVGSKRWIGTVEGMYLMQDYLGADCRMMYCQDAADMASQVPQMINHLEKEGTPIMMGAGQYAYTCVGICFDGASGEAAFMVVDPHYTGADELKPILSKGWVGWKKLDFFEKATENADGAFINCCLPMVPRGEENL